MTDRKTVQALQYSFSLAVIEIDSTPYDDQSGIIDARFKEAFDEFIIVCGVQTPHTSDENINRKNKKRAHAIQRVMRILNEQKLGFFQEIDQQFGFPIFVVDTRVIEQAMAKLELITKEGNSPLHFSAVMDDLPEKVITIRTNPRLPSPALVVTGS